MARDNELAEVGGFLPRLPSIFDWDEGWFSPRSAGLNVSEDDKNIFVEAPVPGINPEKIDVTYDKGTLWIRANEEENVEDKKKKFYRRAARSYSYRVDVPGNVDENKEPEVSCENGILKAVFTKSPITEPKKLHVKSGKK